MIIIKRLLPTQVALATQMVQQYAAELSVDLNFQQVEQELADPLKKYGPPNGAFFIAYHNDEPVGCIAYQRLDDERCEMKRLYVKPAFRGMKVGKQLAAHLLLQAHNDGYHWMMLDTLQILQPAIHLYRQLGFTECSPYYYNPLPNVVYMEKRLG